MTLGVNSVSTLTAPNGASPGSMRAGAVRVSVSDTDTAVRASAAVCGIPRNRAGLRAIGHAILRGSAAACAGLRVNCVSTGRRL